MEAVEERAARVLERVPAWLWDGESLPVPVEDIADSIFGLLVRDVDDLGVAPGAPQLASSRRSSTLIWPGRRGGHSTPRPSPPRRRGRLVDDLAGALAAEGGTWKAILPRLRDAAQLKRSELVSRLAERLGIAGREEKVARYYHAMEQGRLDPDGVSDHVLRALAELLGTTTERLREAGRALRPQDGTPAAGATFARAAMPAEEHLDVMAAPSGPPPDTEDPDEVDRLFTGGADA